MNKTPHSFRIVLGDPPAGCPRNFSVPQKGWPAHPPFRTLSSAHRSRPTEIPTLGICRRFETQAECQTRLPAKKHSHGTTRCCRECSVSYTKTTINNNKRKKHFFFFLFLRRNREEIYSPSGFVIRSYTRDSDETQWGERHALASRLSRPLEKGLRSLSHSQRGIMASRNNTRERRTKTTSWQMYTWLCGNDR